MIDMYLLLNGLEAFVNYTNAHIMDLIKFTIYMACGRIEKKDIPKVVKKCSFKSIITTILLKVTFMIYGIAIIILIFHLFLMNLKNMEPVGTLT